MGVISKLKWSVDHFEMKMKNNITFGANETDAYHSTGQFHEDQNNFSISRFHRLMMA